MLRNTWKIMIVGLAFIMVASVSMAAGISHSTLQNVKMPMGVTLQNGTQKAMFFGNGQTDVKQALLDMGVLNADVYRLTVKRGNEMNYGLVADIYWGNKGLSRLGTVAEPGRYGEAAALAKAINSSSANGVMPYRVIEPLAGKDGLYSGTLKVNTLQHNVNYGEVLHITAFEDKYAGLMTRVVAIDDDNDAQVWSSIKKSLRVKNK